MKIVTWNMQGAGHALEAKWNTGVSNIYASMKPDALCLQECGSIPESTKRRFVLSSVGPHGDAYKVSVHRSGNDRSHYFVAFLDWDDGAHRCNLAIVTRTRPERCKVFWADDGPHWRPALGVRVDGRWVYTIHAIRYGNDVDGLLNAVASRTPAGKDWIVAGDFNREPGRVNLPPGSAICPPNRPTHPTRHPEKTYDYCVRSAGDPVRGEVLTQILMSDHLPVAYDL